MWVQAFFAFKKRIKLGATDLGDLKFCHTLPNYITYLNISNELSHILRQTGAEVQKGQWCSESSCGGGIVHYFPNDLSIFLFLVLLKTILYIQGFV